MSEPPIGPDLGRTTPVPPVISFDSDGEAYIFETVEAAERYIEPNDVEDDVGTFDSRGLRLRLDANGWVTISAAEAVPTGADELAALLRHALRRAGQVPSVEWTLQQLISAASKAGYLRKA